MNIQNQYDIADLASQSPTGFRLYRMELYNWGTFHDSVWKIEPKGNNSLLTGDIGSGKSTVVDALTTLLVPAQKITFNKAAGAESKERSLNSYVRGAYKSEKSELTQSSKAVTLRDETAYTVLLAWFYNEGFQIGMTLAQVFWLKEGNQNPERFYLTAETPLSIKQDFSNFDGDINKLKRRLRQHQSVKILRSFTEYATQFRRFFGIQSEQALALFYQTVSMKSVGNLTEFVRLHMLEKNEVESRLGDLLQSFDNLNRLHEAVLKARQQIEQLGPLCEELEQYERLQSTVSSLREARDALASWFARLELELQHTHIEKLNKQAHKQTHRLEKLEGLIQSLRDKENDLRRNIEDQGGRRLREIEREITQLQEVVQRCKLQYASYDKACRRLGLPVLPGEAQFYDNQQQLKPLQRTLKLEEIAQQEARDNNAIKLSQQREKHARLEQELESLRQRKSNIPYKNLAIRQVLLDTLQIEEAELPFAGELLQVDEAERRWEGAIERVLHNMGLSLLVPVRHYKRVSLYVEQTQLQGRLVYYSVDGDGISPASIQADSLAEKIHIKPASEFYDWLEHILSKRFNYHCCESLDEFRRYPFALTQNGQVKAGKQRHEKDDRYALQDRSRFVLGWSNREKVKVLEKQRHTLEKKIQELAIAIADVEKQQMRLRKQADSIRDLKNIARFAEVDWQNHAKSIEQLHREQQEIESASDELQQLQKQLKRTQKERLEQEQQEKALFGKQGALKNEIETAQGALSKAKELAGKLTVVEMQVHDTVLTQWQDKTMSSTLSLRNMEKSQREMREGMQASIDNDSKRLNTLTERIIQQMQNYKRNYPAETSEVDARVEGGREYGQMLLVLQKEDLPRHEATFKKMLNEQTIQGVVMFRSQLERERRAIEDKINAINQSLHQVEYDDGTYIKLLASLALDVDIRDFRSELKTITENAYDNEDVYNEERFLKVKSMMERFRGREGQVEQDLRWTCKVTDVRNWYNFSASECWRESDEEKEFYSDSAGKSGGQKEKLAYTILASALAYQFGLEWGENRSRSFRFVAIDEAFGRGSDESTRYALELFRKLRLQLLIVTPLQKIHVIENYINAVHFVHNQEGKNSMIRNLSIEEYQEEKAGMSASKGKHGKNIASS
jgi:uncharacterized protein YPO0396